MGYFKTIPLELEECALIDGASRLQILVKIILPLAVPGLISAGIFAFTLSWNEFIYALTFISSSEVKTVPVGVVTELVEGDVYHWGSLMAGALLGLAARRGAVFVLRRVLRLRADGGRQGIAATARPLRLETRASRRHLGRMHAYRLTEQAMSDPGHDPRPGHADTASSCT